MTQYYHQGFQINYISHLFFIFSLLCSHYVADLIKKLELNLMVVSVLLEIKFGHAQLSLPKIGIRMLKAACISPWPKIYYYCLSWRTPLGEGEVNSHNHWTKTYYAYLPATNITVSAIFIIYSNSIKHVYYNCPWKFQLFIIVLKNAWTNWHNGRAC